MTLGMCLYSFGWIGCVLPAKSTSGAASGLAIVISTALENTIGWEIKIGTIVLFINVVLLIIAGFVLGWKFGIKTIYCILVLSLSMNGWQEILPADDFLHIDRFLSMVVGGVITGVGVAMAIMQGGSAGGTDIVAMLLKKYTTMEIGTAIFAVDIIITLSAFVAFDFATGLYSVTGLMAKTLIMDGAIENMNLCKYFTIITTNPKPICDFIHHELHRSATIYKAEGAYSHTEKNIVLVVLKRSQAVRLRRFIKEIEPTAFMMITNSSEIIGKGFRGFN